MWHYYLFYSVRRVEALTYKPKWSLFNLYTLTWIHTKLLPIVWWQYYNYCNCHILIWYLFILGGGGRGEERDLLKVTIHRIFVCSENVALLIFTDHLAINNFYSKFSSYLSNTPSAQESLCCFSETRSAHSKAASKLVVNDIW